MRRALTLIGLLALLGALGLWFLAGRYTEPAHRAVGDPPRELVASPLTLTAADGVTVSGWWSPGEPGRGVVLLLHALRGDRRQMLDRALFLHRQGRGTLLIDLPGHGESGGDRITFGARESTGVSAALAFLAREQPCEARAVIGVSLGAASTVLAQPRAPLDAVVLESMYPSIDEAVADRLRLHAGPWAGVFAPLLLAPMPLRIGVTPAQLRPVDHIAGLGAPVMILSGTDDRHTTAAETQRLFDVAGEPRSLWLVPGAAHVDLHRFAPAEWETRVSDFLARTMAVSRCPVSG